MKELMTNNHIEMRNFLFDKYKKVTFSRKECAKIIGVSLPTLDRLTRNKKIKSMGITRFVLFSIDEIARILSGTKPMK